MRKFGNSEASGINAKVKIDKQAMRLRQEPSAIEDETDKKIDLEMTADCAPR